MYEYDSIHEDTNLDFYTSKALHSIFLVVVAIEICGAHLGVVYMTLKILYILYL
jgi:hypothetical protein